jgi:hypothetical protein
MRVIIPGGTGLIGRPLADRLVKDGHEVVVLSRDPARVAGLPAKVTLAAWDGRTAAGWGHLADGAGAIVNLAGAGLSEGRWTEARKAAIRDSRVQAGQAVVEAVRAAAKRPGVLIQSSAVGFYGPRGDELVTEEAPGGQDFLAQVCRDWEAATAEVEALGSRRCVVRTGVVLSGAGGALPRMAMPFRFFAGGRVGNGRQWLSWIHMADAVGGIRHLIQVPDAGGVFNLTAPYPLTSADFARALGKAMGRPSLLPVPGFALKLAFGEMSTVLLNGQRALPQRLEQVGYMFQFAHASTALADIYG